MFVQEYDVELLSDVSITSDAATSGPHSSLDFLPGSVFLGAAVNASLKRGEKFDHDFFLSGHTRFMNALPMAGDELCRPIPLCFAYRKGAEWEGDSPVNFLNRKQESTKKEGKIKQWKEGYISENGTVFHTLMNDAVKTAIDRDRRRAKDSQLFSTQSITAGTHFRIAVHADSEEDLNRADNLLFSEGGLLRIGRSRSAEYGAVKLTRLKESAGAKRPCVPGTGLIYLYLLSDLYLMKDGIPAMMPAAEDFFLDGASFSIKDSFLRGVTNTPWNSFFNSRMSMRQGIARGSVLAFSINGGYDEAKVAEIEKRLEQGIGLFREEGCGRVLVNPRWLISSDEFKLKKYRPCVSCKAAAQKTETPLLNYLKAKREREVEEYDTFVKGGKWAEDINNKYYRKIPGLKLPSASQWGAIAEIALSASYGGDLLKSLEDFCTNAQRKLKWYDRDSAPNKESLFDFITAKIKEEKMGRKEKFCALALFYAAKDMSKALRTRKGRR